MLDDVVISKAIIETYTRDLVANLDVDAAIAGAGPAGLTAAYYLARAGATVTIFERNISPGGGMPGGGMMFNKIVVQKEAKAILDQFEIQMEEYDSGYYVADSLETISAICLAAIRAGARIFNLISVEDLMVKNDAVTGLVLNWAAVVAAKLHVDPLTIRARAAVDATGHAAELCHILARKTGPQLATETGDVMGERSMDADAGEGRIVANTKAVYPGLYVAGMAANAVLGAPRMGPIFGGMLLSGKKAAELILDDLDLGG